MQLQVTIMSDKGYKPISTLVEIPMKDLVKKNYGEYTRKGLEKICIKKLWNRADMLKYGYTKIKCRPYDKEKIEQENKERYEKIKKEKGWN